MLRLREDLRQRLLIAAEVDDRSLNAEINFRLEESFVSDIKHQLKMSVDLLGEELRRVRKWSAELEQRRREFEEQVSQFREVQLEFYRQTHEQRGKEHG
jgi:hypothetical protein